MLPKAKDKPTRFGQLIGDHCISGHVRGDFLLPEFTVVGGCLIVGRAVMPETAIDKHSHFTARENHIGLTWQAEVEPVAEPHRPKQFPYADFRRRVPAFDAGHAAAALLRRQDICHKSGGRVHHIGSGGALHLLVKALFKDLGNHIGKLVCQKRWNGIAHLPELIPPVTLEEIVVWERLQPGSFPDSQAAALMRVGVNKIVTILGQMRGDRGGRVIPNLYPEAVSKIAHTSLFIRDGIGMVWPKHSGKFMQLW